MRHHLRRHAWDFYPMRFSRQTVKVLTSQNSAQMGDLTSWPIEVGMTDHHETSQDGDADSSQVNNGNNAQTNLQRTILDILLDHACEDGLETSSEEWEKQRGAVAKGISFPWFFRQQ